MGERSGYMDAEIYLHFSKPHKNFKHMKTKNNFVYNTLLFLPLLVLGVSFIYLHLFKSESAFRSHNYNICIEHLKNEYSGIVVDVNTFKKSKMRVVILQDSTFINPLGLIARQLDSIKIGDSIIKKKNTRRYVVFQNASKIDSFIIEPYYGNNCSR